MKNVLVKGTTLLVFVLVVGSALALPESGQVHAASTQTAISSYQRGWNAADNDIYGFVKKFCTPSYWIAVEAGYFSMGPLYSCNGNADYAWYYWKNTAWQHGYTARYEKLVNYLTSVGCRFCSAHMNVSKDRSGTHVTCVRRKRG
jgi:hypothetical protein